MKFLVSSLSGKDNCNDFSDYYDIIAPLDKLIMSFIAYGQPDRKISVFYAFPYNPHTFRRQAICR